jgi:Arc/MetJ-type ribon-helix-helix transcriptional regulator
MTATKIAISLPPSIAARARRAVQRGHAASVSAYVAAALEEKVKMDDLSALLAEMLEESGGPLTRAEQHTADRSLGLLAKKPRTTRKRR